MKILVCICSVPDTTTKINFTADKKALDKNGVQFVIGPYDDYALSKAVDMKTSHGATVTVLNVGEADTEPVIRKALAIGADDAVRINVNPSDTLLVAQEIAAYAKDKNYDLILMGRESTDFNSAAVHGMVGEILGIPSVSPIMKLELNGTTAEVSREIEGGTESLSLSIPFVAGCQEPIAEWKIPNMRGIMSARTKPLTVVDSASTEKATGLENYSTPPARSECKMIDKDNVAELVNLLKNEAKVI